MFLSIKKDKPDGMAEGGLGITLREKAEDKEENKASPARLGPGGVDLGAGVGGHLADHVPGGLPHAPTRLGYLSTDPIRHFPTRTHTRLCKG